MLIKQKKMDIPVRMTINRRYWENWKLTPRHAKQEEYSWLYRQVPNSRYFTIAPPCVVFSVLYSLLSFKGKFNDMSLLCTFYNP